LAVEPIADDEPQAKAQLAVSGIGDPALRSTQLTLFGNALMSFAWAFDTISELAIL
jgi:hypothetical protein